MHIKPRVKVIRRNNLSGLDLVGSIMGKLFGSGGGGTTSNTNTNTLTNTNAINSTIAANISPVMQQGYGTGAAPSNSGGGFSVAPYQSATPTSYTPVSVAPISTTTPVIGVPQGVMPTVSDYGIPPGLTPSVSDYGMIPVSSSIPTFGTVLPSTTTVESPLMTAFKQYAPWAIGGIVLLMIIKKSRSS